MDPELLKYVGMQGSLYQDEVNKGSQRALYPEPKGLWEEADSNHITLSKEASDVQPEDSCPFKSNLQAWFFPCFRCTLWQVLLTFWVTLRVIPGYFCLLNHSFNIKITCPM